MENERPAGPYVEFRKNLLPPARVRELSRLEPWRVVRDVLACWLVIVATWIVVARWPAWWTLLLAIPIVGTRYYALFIIGHDGLHRRLFSRAKDNDLFCDICIFGAIGAITRINNRNHLSHHQHLASATDPDRHKHGSFNKTRPIELAGFLTGASSLLRSVRNVFSGKAGSRATAPVDPAPAQDLTKRAKYTLRDISVLLVWQIALIGGLSFGVGFWAWPVLWLLPVYVFTFLGDNARSFFEHSQPETDLAADQHRLITFMSNPVERMFLAPMNMNYHAAHHLWPSIPYYNLPIANREMHALPAAQDIEIRGSYLGYLRRYCSSLPIATTAAEEAS